MYGKEEAFFDPRGVSRETSANVVVNPGEYLCEITKAVSREKDGNQGLMVHLSILCPTVDRGRGLMDYFNLKHASAQATAIGRASLAKMLDALERGGEQLVDPSSLEKSVVKCKVGLKPHYKDASQSQNVIEKYLPLDKADELAIKKALMAPETNDVPF